MREGRQWAIDATKGIRGVEYDWRREASDGDEYPKTTISVPVIEPGDPELAARMGEGDVRVARVDVEVRALSMDAAYDMIDKIEEAFVRAQGDREVDFAGFEASWEMESQPIVMAVSRYWILVRG